MHDSRCPALPAAIVYLAVLAVPDDLRLWCVGISLGGVVLALARGAGSPTRLVVIALLGGLWTAGAERGVDPGPLATQGDRELEARVLAAPQADLQGRRRLRVEIGRTVLRLTVAPSPPVPTSRIDALRSGDRIRVWCHFRGEDSGPGWRKSLRRRRLAVSGVDAACRIKSARLVMPLERGSPGPRRWIDQAAHELSRRLAEALDGRTPHVGLAQAMLLGRRQATEPATVRQLRDSGLVHLVAISGLHVGFLFAAGCWLVRRTCRATSSWLLLVPFLGLFALLVGGRPSVVRACAAAGVILLGRAVGREGNPLNTLAILAAALATWEPILVHDIGYRLTFVATASIVAGTRRLEVRLPLPPFLARGAAASLAAYLGTAPLLALHFGRLAPVGLAGNLIAFPLCGWVLAAGYPCMLLRGVPIFEELAVRGLVLGLDGLTGLAGGLAELPLGWFAVPRPEPLLLAGYYTLGILILSTGVRHLPVLVFCGLVVWLHLGAPPPRIPGGLRASVIDVGQGQAVALQGPAGGCVLVDAGGSWDPRYDPGERTVVPFLRDWGCARIETLILSHQDTDHVAGAPAVLRSLEVGELWVGPRWFDSPRMRGVVRQAGEKGVAVRLVQRGTVARPAGIPAHVLAPGRDQLTQGDNDRSIVVLAGREPARILIPGDVEAAGEDRLLASAGTLRAEALVLAHHGSRGSNQPGFLRRVRPDVTLVSSGPGNRFGHPHEEVIHRVDEVDATLHRTDLRGTLLLHATAHGWQVESRWPQK